ncbi:unnamed protein product [Prorocentrum cordatum]|uniref:Uncharacterized protein n=1 Tax=Prorocentrum cordatum TaxID=2364126 RepID=A0ABN9VJE5_9DINO|nr:unnamed protein product [Polarella glacialis]
MGWEVHPYHSVFVSDLLGLASEGCSWSESLQRGRRKRAGAWRDVFRAALQRRAENAVQFVWAPARRDIESVLDDPQEVECWLGNAWADCFANAGVAHHLIANAASESSFQALNMSRGTIF